jgi:large subunit ribosomal protein L31
MKAAIHPTYYSKAKITCSCGHVIETGSTREAYTTELCSKCHPFYTGKKRTVDTAGRIEMFEARRKKAAEKKAEETTKTPKKRRTIEEKVNEELLKERERERKEDEKLMNKIRKNRPKEIES